jgi:hypothetical protein
VDWLEDSIPQYLVVRQNLFKLHVSRNITTQKGESKPMDLPFLLPQSRISRACGLTPDLKMRYGSDIHIIPEK